MPYAAVAPAKSMKPETSRVLFARIGSMTRYAGPQEGDERPKAGGDYNRKNVGHEIFNFAEFCGRLYGFVRAKAGHIRLERIDPVHGNGNDLDDVLVIFVARQRIVGWYNGATVYREGADIPNAAIKDMKKRLDRFAIRNFEFMKYTFEAPVNQAVLLPESHRTQRIPAVRKGGFGQSNVRYAYSPKGKLQRPAWMERAIEYVRNCEKGNLLVQPTDESAVMETITTAQEQAAGFRSNPKIRRAIEDFAMQKAKAELLRRGYTTIHNTSSTKPYDYSCKKAGDSFFVEVKGTQTLGKSVIVTRGEVEHAHTHKGSCIFVLVHSVKVTGKKNVSVTGGKVEFRENWSPDEGDLTPIQYMWKLS